jgi:large subunit ribosomal protein L1
MGKRRTRIIGLEEVEEKQKKEQKEKSAEKKIKKVKTEKVAVIKEKISQDKPVTAKQAKLKESSKVKEIKVSPRGQQYQQARKLIDSVKTYSLAEAIKLLKKIKYAKFDESVELHFNVDEAGLKGEVTFPNSTGKTIKVKIIDDKVLADIEKGKLDFDILVTHPSFMPRLAKFAKILGPKGLMPNPKAGTISTNPQDVVKKFTTGTLRWKTEAKFPLIHQLIGKLSLEEKKLIDNAQAFIKAVGKTHIQKAVLKSTMSPGIKLDIEKI